MERNAALEACVDMAKCEIDDTNSASRLPTPRHVRGLEVLYTSLAWNSLACKATETTRRG